MDQPSGERCGRHTVWRTSEAVDDPPRSRGVTCQKVYRFSEGGPVERGPQEVFSTNLGESIRSLQGGRVSSDEHPEIVACTFRGRICSLTTQPLDQVLMLLVVVVETMTSYIQLSWGQMSGSGPDHIWRKRSGGVRRAYFSTKVAGKDAYTEATVHAWRHDEYESKSNAPF